MHETSRDTSLKEITIKDIIGKVGEISGELDIS